MYLTLVLGSDFRLWHFKYRTVQELKQNVIVDVDEVQNPDKPLESEYIRPFMINNILPDFRFPLPEKGEDTWGQLKMKWQKVFLFDKFHAERTVKAQKLFRHGPEEDHDAVNFVYIVMFKCIQLLFVTVDCFASITVPLKASRHGKLKPRMRPT